MSDLRLSDLPAATSVQPGDYTLVNQTVGGVTTTRTGTVTQVYNSASIANLASPSPIGSVTPNTGAFTSLSTTLGLTGTLLTAAQPNITSVGSLTGLTVLAPVTLANAVSSTQAVALGQLSNNTQAVTFTTGAFSGALTVINAVSSAQAVALGQLNNNSEAVSFTSGAFSGALTVINAVASTQAVALGQLNNNSEAVSFTTGVFSGALTVLNAASSAQPVALGQLNNNTQPVSFTTGVFSGALTVLNAAATNQPVAYGQADGRYAALAGLSTQIFRAANAVGVNDAVALGQILPTASKSSSRVTTTVAQAIVAATFTLVQFNTIGFDDLAEFNTATFLWTVKAAGTYIVGGSVYGSQGVATNRIVEVFVNGAEAGYLSQSNSDTGATARVGSALIRLAAGATVGIYYYSALADTLNTSTNATYATLERVK